MEVKLRQSVFLRKIATSECHVFNGRDELDSVAGVFDGPFVRIFPVCERELVVLGRNCSGGIVNVDRALALSCRADSGGPVSALSGVVVDGWSGT